VGKLVLASGIEIETKWADLSKTQLQNSNQLTNGTFQVNGKSTFKEEFVTAGGINLKEVNFKPWKANCTKTCILREKLNIDAIYGRV
jgi:predicted flavoprotein YhiN